MSLKKTWMAQTKVLLKTSISPFRHKKTHQSRGATRRSSWVGCNQVRRSGRCQPPSQRCKKEKRTSIVRPRARACRATLQTVTAGRRMLASTWRPAGANYSKVTGHDQIQSTASTDYQKKRWLRVMTLAQSVHKDEAYRGIQSALAHNSHLKHPSGQPLTQKKKLRVLRGPRRPKPDSSKTPLRRSWGAKTISQSHCSKCVTSLRILKWVCQERLLDQTGGVMVCLRRRRRCKLNR